MKCLALFIFLFVFIENRQTSSIDLNLDANKAFSFGGVSITIGSETFVPSNLGGVSVWCNNQIFNYWSDGVKFTAIKETRKSNFLSANWIMYKKNVFYYHYEVNYEVEGLRLIINIKDLGRINNNDTLPLDYAEINAVYLDRCENAINPHIIGVPYLSRRNNLR